jgi:hypothetical protein
MPNRSSKRPRDPNQPAKLVVEIAAGDVADPTGFHKKDPAAVSLGRRGGLKGGNARASALSSEQRSAIAKKAAEARWKTAKDE